MSRPTALPPEQARRLREYESLFRRQGLPSLVADHSARRDVFGRSAPMLLVLLLLELAATMSTDWPWWVNLLVVVGGALVIAAVYAVANVLRGRPWATLPQDVGPAELAVFVLAPALAALAAGGQWGYAVTVILVNLLTLAVLRVVVGNGIHSTVFWGAARLTRELGDSLLRLVRFLPLLLVFAIGLFFSTEIWQVFNHTAGVADFVLGGFFVVLILAILTLGLRTEVTRVLDAAHAGAGPGLLPLTGRQRRNFGLMVWSSQLMQVVVVSSGVFLFFVMLGVLTVTRQVMDAWGLLGGGVAATHVWSLGQHFVTSQVHLRVAVALATFTGLYYAISVLTDSVYREDFIGDMAEKTGRVLASRTEYEALRTELGLTAAVEGHDDGGTPAA